METTALRGWRRSAVTIGSCSFIVQWDLTGSPRGSGVPRTQGADPPPHLNYKKTSTATVELCFIPEVKSNVCVVFQKTNIWFQASVLLNHVCVRVCACIPQPRPPAAQECVCCFPITVVLLQMLSDAKMLAFLKGTPNLFCFFT